MSEAHTRDWGERVAALSATQRRALADALAREMPDGGRARLVAFVVSAPSLAPSDAELRAFLSARLPDYMVPARFVALDRLPRTAAGKLDRRALARATGTDLQSTTPARTEVTPQLSDVEATLVAIWRDVLKVDDVGIDDDFFEIGGDSLLSIRVIARAGREGLRISPERFFEQPTVRQMAASAVSTRARAEAATAPQDSRGPMPEAVGEAPLTPIQHWFLEAIPAHRDWWNQGYVLALDHAISAQSLRQVTRVLVAQHPALRLRLVQRDGRWRQDFVAPGGVVPLRAVSLEQLAPDAYAARIAEEGEREHASLRLDDGSLFRVVLFEGAEGWRRLLLLGHHLVLDGVSWQVILEDLAALVRQAIAGEALQLPAASSTASPRAWAIGLEERAATAPLAGMAAHWLEMPADGGAVPVDMSPDGGGASGQGVTTSTHTTQRDAEIVTFTLDRETTRTLLHDAPARLEGTVQALLLSALLLAWHAWTGTEVLRLDLEGHGRDVLGDAFDASRTVGWFTTVFPLRLALPPAPGASAPPSAASAVRAVQQALDALPLRGAAHGLLRYLSPDDALRARLAARPRPAVLFNYLGVHDLALPPDSPLRVTDTPAGRARDPEGARPYLLELNSLVQDGRLVVAIEHARQVHSRATMERFAALLRESLGRIALGRPDSSELSGLDAAGLQAVAELLGALDAGDDWDEDVSP